MDPIKIKNFERSHHGMRFPTHHSLNPSETEKIRQRLRIRLHLPGSSDGLELLHKLSEMANICHHANAADNGFNIHDLIKSMEIHPEDKIYINWYRFDVIDTMDYDSLVSFFDDIWYPSSDDIEIFDSSLGWIVTITHYGQISHAAW